MRKSYNFLSKVCTRREHIKINNYISNSNNNNNNNNNNKYIKKIERKKREKKKAINIYLRNKGIEWKTQDCLRYYATLKLRKFELLFYKINTCFQKTTTCIGLWEEQVFSANI